MMIFDYNYHKTKIIISYGRVEEENEDFLLLIKVGLHNADIV